jgi:hypothetical protein
LCDRPLQSAALPRRVACIPFNGVHNL